MATAHTASPNLNVNWTPNVSSVGAVGNMDLFIAGVWQPVTAWNNNLGTLQITAASGATVINATTVRTTGPLNIVFSNGVPAGFPDQVLVT